MWKVGRRRVERRDGSRFGPLGHGWSASHTSNKMTLTSSTQHSIVTFPLVQLITDRDEKSQEVGGHGR